MHARLELPVYPHTRCSYDQSSFQIRCAPWYPPCRCTMEQKTTWYVCSMPLSEIALLWASPVWHYSKQLVRRLNAFHVTMVRRVLKLGRHAGEAWLDFEVRTRQLAKQVLHEQRLDLYGAFATSNASGRMQATWHVAMFGPMLLPMSCTPSTCNGGEKSAIVSDTQVASFPSR